MTFAPGAVRPGSKPIEYARQHLGHAEVTRNRSPLIDSWKARCRLDPTKPYAWCASFLCCMIEDAGYKWVKSASVKRMLDANTWALVDEPEYGDVLVHLNPDGTGHTAFFEQTLRDKIESLDGNSDPSGTREGKLVCMVVRPAVYWHYFMRPVPYEKPSVA